MAAPARYPTPHAQLLRLAEDAKREGIPFEEFWDRAVRPGLPPVTYYQPEAERLKGCVVWPRDSVDRNLARAATEDSREGWRRAYEGVEPTRSERALIVLSPLLAMIEGARGIEEREGVPSPA